jgi:hypothetical protein
MSPTTAVLLPALAGSDGAAKPTPSALPAGVPRSVEAAPHGSPVGRPKNAPPARPTGYAGMI